MAAIVKRPHRKRKKGRSLRGSSRAERRSPSGISRKSQNREKRDSDADIRGGNFTEGFITFDRQGRVTSWNEGAEAIYGYSAEEMMGKTLRMTVPKGALKEWRNCMKRVIVDGENIWNQPLKRTRKDGKRIRVVTTYSPIRRSDGKIVGGASIVREVTEKRFSGEREADSRPTSQARTKTSQDIVLIWSTDGRFLDINQAGVEALGYRNKEEMMRLKVPNDVCPNPREWKDLEADIANKGYAFNHKVRVRRNDGKVIDLLETSTPIRNEVGNIVGYQGVFRNATERKAISGERKGSENEYRSIIEHSPDGIAIIYNGRIVFGNQAFASIYGYNSPDSLVNRSIVDLVEDTEKQEVLDWFLHSQLSEGKGGHREFKVQRKGNESIDVEVRVNRIPFEGRTCLLSSHRVITERSQLHHGLSETERIVGDILTTMGDALVITDLHGKVLQVNLEFEKMTGFSRKEALGLEFPYPWLLEEEMSRFVLWISELRTKYYLHDFDMHWLTKDRRKLAVSLNTTLLRNSRREPIAMLNIARDISERKRLSEELEARTKQIEALYQETLAKSLEIERRNKELDDFTYVVSHDLKEPLVTIEGYGKILHKDFEKKLGSTGLEYLNSVITATDRMKKFIDDLLALTRLSRITESFQPTSIGLLLEEIQRDFEFTLRERNVRLIVEDRMPVISCNGSQMKLVLQNLISNAIKFNDKASPVITIGYQETPNDHQFFVKDNGIGIEGQYFDKIFGIFQRLHRPEEYGGTGVGLTIVKKIVDMHQGRIWLESNVGKGTTFYISIPKAQG